MDQLSHNCFTVTYLGRYLVKYDSYEGANEHNIILFQKTSSLSTVLTNVHECKSQILKQKKEKKPEQTFPFKPTKFTHMYVTMGIRLT